MNYIEVRLVPTPASEDVCDVLASLLGPLGYDSFDTEYTDATQEAVALKAYVTVAQWDEPSLRDMLDSLPLDGVTVAWTATEVQTEDWNRQWEQSQLFEPIVVGEADAEGRVPCCVHSPATPAEQLPKSRYDVIIDPRMSFGTGTHETTSQLLDEILAYGERHPQMAEGLPVLDMGTGTGVLAILCAHMGAQVRAIEIDDWVADNARDNVLLNGLAGRVVVECGDASLLAAQPAYALVLANINRNVLVADMPRYAAVMRPGAELLLSGFYEEDLPAVRAAAEAQGLHFVTHRQRNNWTVARFQKP